MAIVKTTPQETASGEPVRNGRFAPPEAPSTPVVRDTTRSVVRQQQRVIAPRQPGMAQRSLTQSNEPVLSVQSVITELKRVVWPTRVEVQSGTIVTILLLVVFGLYISGLDILVKGLFTFLGLYPHSTS